MKVFGQRKRAAAAIAAAGALLALAACTPAGSASQVEGRSPARATQSLRNNPEAHEDVRPHRCPEPENKASACGLPALRSCGG